MKHHWSVAALGFWLTGTGCVGGIGNSDREEGPPGNAPRAPSVAPRGPAGPGGVTGGSSTLDPGKPPGMTAVPNSVTRARSPMRRLTRFEYNNTVRDLLGDKTRPADTFPTDDAPGSFASAVAGAQVSALLLDKYASTAERLAAAAMANLATLVPCKPDPASDEACARVFIGDFGLRAFRRPLAPDEIGGYLGVFTRNRAEGDFANGVRAVVETMLQSPWFLYRIEQTPQGAMDGTVVALSPYEIATRLSYFLWGTMPDRELFAAAQAGKLRTAAEIEQQARRLLGDARAREAQDEFFRQWLALASLDVMTKDKVAFPDFTEEMRGAMRSETIMFSGQTMASDGRLGTLLTSSRSFVNKALAKVYGMTSTSTAMVAVDLDPAQRGGVLTQPSVLALTAHAANTSPTRRGKFVREQLMCQPPPPPPPNVDTALAAARPGQTARERYQVHVSNPNCATCHTLIDPIGFGFENYDALGRFRVTDQQKPVDATGVISASMDADGVFEGVVALGRKLASSQQVRDCVAKQWFEYAHGRADEDGDRPAFTRSIDAFAASGLDMRVLVLALASSEAFQTRLMEVGP